MDTTQQCPVCLKYLRNVDIDAHVDACLNGTAQPNDYQNPQDEMDPETKALIEQLMREQMEPPEKQDTNLDQIECTLCSQPKPFESMTMLNCGHFFCSCLQSNLMRRIAVGSTNLRCLFEGCGTSITEANLRVILTDEQYKKYTDSPLEKLIKAQPENYKRCPQCHILIERVKPTQIDLTQRVIGPNGVALNKEALKHREECRMRCQTCNTDFCWECSVHPYHLGYTCKELEELEKSRLCMFCEAKLDPKNTAPSKGVHKLLLNCCTDPICLQRRKTACTHEMGCGHRCGGIDGETNHLGCLVCSKEAKEFCTICGSDQLGSAPTLRLGCQHLFHLHCVLKHIGGRWHSAAISFGFMHCVICKTLMSHPRLTSTLQPYIAMHEDVRKKALQRFESMKLGDAPELKEKGGFYYNNPEKYAMARFCYYECAQCKKPYFGGLKECNAEQRIAEFDPKELLCGGCSSNGNDTSCKKHGADYIEYKCRFCCNVAAWFCWGNTHFCEECHRVASVVAKKPKDQLPACTCGVKHAPQGEEWCLGCSLCRFEMNF